MSATFKKTVFDPWGKLTILTTVKQGKFQRCTLKWSDNIRVEVVKVAEGDYTVTLIAWDSALGCFRVERSERIKAANGNAALEIFRTKLNNDGQKILL